MINVDLTYSGIEEKDLDAYQSKVNELDKALREKTGKGNDFLGWIDYPLNYDKDEFNKIKETVKKLKGKYDTVVVCGIGGSYLGTRACIEMVQGLYSKNDVKIVYLGNTFSQSYVAQVLDYLKDRNFIINVISKSGTTTETSIAFRLVSNLAYEKYGEDAKNRILVTTDKEKGVLKGVANDKGYETFTIPSDVGGRYSVFTSVGLLPLALCGIDIDKLMKGSLDAYNDFNKTSIKDNPAYKYAVARRILNKKYVAEFFISYHLQFQMFAEWWKQLYGESEGKDGKGLFPTSAIYSTDLHSMGQFIQDGSHVLFETLLNVKNLGYDLEFPKDSKFDDKMDYLNGKKLSFVNESAMKGTLKAHTDGGVPHIIINLDDNSEYSFGYLIYFFFLACGMSCYLLDINPFNQPGVEVYKKNMFKLLGKI